MERAGSRGGFGGFVDAAGQSLGLRPSVGRPGGVVLLAT
jgi:hypothetical protein